MYIHLAPCSAGCTGQDEAADREPDGVRKRADNVVLLVAVRNPRLVVVHEPRNRKLLHALETQQRIFLDPKHLVRSGVIPRSRNPEDEVSREQVFAVLLAEAILVDEDVCERRSRVANVGALLEPVEEPSDQSVDRGWIEVWIGAAILVVGDVPGVDRRVIGFVVNDEERHIGNNKPARFGMTLLLYERRPLDQISENRGILLDDQQYRIGSDHHVRLPRDTQSEVP